jgi:hypothetical protein
MTMAPMMPQYTPSADSARGDGGGGSGGSPEGGPSSQKQARRSSGKTSHSRSYPRGVGLDFRKLAGLTLVSYIDHHGTFTLYRWFEILL